MHKINLFTKLRLALPSRVERLGFLILVFFHVLAAHTSFGFHHPDEHYQILEFANYWIGLVPNASHLPWEFGAQIRPWFQPILHGLVMKAALIVGHYNPFTLAEVFRLVYAALNLWCLVFLWQEFKKRWSLPPIWFLWVSCLWFFPYIHVRTSSENLSGIFLTFAFALYYRSQKWFWPGILFGFAFVARSQVALGLAGMGLFLLAQDRKIKKEHWVLLGAFLIPVLFGTLLDSWAYGNWVFTPYRYFKVNLVEGVAATFNPYPWYQYFIWIAELNPLVSLPLFAGVVLYVKRVKMDAIAAFVLTFFVLHLFITNKEYRFFFPLLNLVPFLAAVGWQPYFHAASRRSFFIPYAIISLLAFAVSTLHGASVGTLWHVHMVNRYAKPDENWLSNRDYLEQFNAGYYHLDHHSVTIYHTGAELEKELLMRAPVKVLVDGKLSDQSTQEILSTIERHHCEALAWARPPFLYSFEKWIPAISRLTFQTIYECPPKQ